MISSLSSLERVFSPVEGIEKITWAGDEYALIADAEPQPDRPALLDPYDLCGESVKRWYAAYKPKPRPWRCYFSNRMSVSGLGTIWFDNLAVIDLDLVAPYWRREFVNPIFSRALFERDLPLRSISDPCISVVSWGWEVYGHFLIDALPRLLGAKAVLKDRWAETKILLRDDTPTWFLSALFDTLDVDKAKIEFFDPRRERVMLKRGIFPGYAYREGFFHKSLNAMIDDIKLERSPGGPRTRKVFLSRMGLSKDRQAIRGCRNESDLAALAEREFDYEVVAPERLPWVDQVNLFRRADVVVGLTGSALHTSIFAGPELTVGFIGFLNQTQCDIAALRGQTLAALGKGVHLKPGFEVNQDMFHKFLEGLSQRQVLSARR